MNKLLSLIEQAFDEAELTENAHGTREVKRLLQQCAAQLDVDTALRLRSRISSGAGVRNSGATVITETAQGRFGRTPPPQIFSSPNLKATGESARPVATDEVTDAPDFPDEEIHDQDKALTGTVKEVHMKIVNMQPDDVARTYGESGVEGMIKVLGGKIIGNRKPVQKAAYLITLIKKHYENPPAEQ
jgi:hypothetical protein